MSRFTSTATISTDDGYGQRLLKLLTSLLGAADPKMAPRAGLPSLNIAIGREAVARYGINAGDVA
jgi:Cu/Ag efflux pump CusA